MKNPGHVDDRGSNIDNLVEVMGLCSNPSWIADLGKYGGNVSTMAEFGLCRVRRKIGK